MPVCIIHEDVATLNAADDNVLEEAGYVDPSCTWHSFSGSYIMQIDKVDNVPEPIHYRGNFQTVCR